VRSWGPRHLIGLTLLFYMVSGFGTAFGATWCIPSAGGHALRAMLDVCCDPCRDSVPVAPLATTVTAESCGQCLDVELRFPSLQSRNRSLAETTATPVAVSRFAIPVQTHPAPTGAGLKCTKGPRLALRHLATVVLVI